MTDSLLTAERFWDTSYNTGTRMRFRMDTRILSGNVLSRMPDVVSEFGNRCMLFADSALVALPLFHEIHESLSRTTQIKLITIEPGEPTESQLFELKKEVETNPCDFFLAIGGGSVIDLCKALRFLINQEVSDITEAFSREQMLHSSGFPLIAIPTTAATGAEVSRYVVIKDNSGRKRGFRSWRFCPEVALIDPHWLVSLSDRQIVTGAVDIVAHCYEGFVSKGEYSTITDQFCLSGMKLVTGALNNLLEGKPRTDSFYQDLAQAATFGGIVLSNVRLGLIHGCGEALASFEKIDHGHSLALFFAESVQQDVPYLTQRFNSARSHLKTNCNNFYEFLKPLFYLIKEHRLNRIQLQNDIAFLGTTVTESVVADHVLLKESPKPLKFENVRDFVMKNILASLAEVH